MTAMHPSRRWRGCPTCKYWKGHNGMGRSLKEPVRVLRKVGGKRKRVSRRDLGD